MISNPRSAFEATLQDFGEFNAPNDPLLTSTNGFGYGKGPGAQTRIGFNNFGDKQDWGLGHQDTSGYDCGTSQGHGLNNCTGQDHIGFN